MENGTAGQRQTDLSPRQAANVAANVVGIDPGNLAVVAEALSIFEFDRSQIDAPPYESLGRARVMLRALEEAGVKW